jgi:hypothetical protein
MAGKPTNEWSKPGQVTAANSLALTIVCGAEGRGPFLKLHADCNPLRLAKGEKVSVTVSRIGDIAARAQLARDT